MPIKCYSGQRLDPSFEDHASLIENLPEMNDVHDNNHNHDARDQSLFAPTCALADVRRIHLGRRPAGTATYFASLNIPMPSIAVWVSVVIHLLGGLGILIGFKTRWAAALLLLLCLGTAFGVHLAAGDMENMIHFYKNLVMAGGFLYVIAFGAGAISVDEGMTAR